MAKYNVLRDHPNAQPLVKAWDAAGEGASFLELLLSYFPPRPWLSSEASRKKLESMLSKVSLDSSPSSQANWRNARKSLDDAVKYGKSSGWDTGAEPYTGPLPTYEDIEAIRIIGSKPTGGCGMLPNPIQNRINDAHVEFLLEDPSNRKTPIHPFWASRVAADYPATGMTTEGGEQATGHPPNPNLAHAHATETLPKSMPVDGHDQHDDDDDEGLADSPVTRPISRMTTRSAAKKTQQELPGDESEEESPRSPLSSPNDGWEDVTGPPQDNDEEEEDDQDDDQDDDHDHDEDDQDDESDVADHRPSQGATISQTLITSHAFIGLLTDALADTSLPITTTTAVRKAVNADSGALRRAMEMVLVRATDIWLAEYKKPIVRYIGGSGDDGGGGEGANAGDRGRNKKRRRTSSSVGAQRRN